MARTAHDLAWPDLVWCHFSRPRFGHFDERLDAAAAAGYAGIGLYGWEYQRLRHQEERQDDGHRSAGGRARDERRHGEYEVRQEQREERRQRGEVPREMHR